MFCMYAILFVFFKKRPFQRSYVCTEHLFGSNFFLLESYRKFPFLFLNCLLGALVSPLRYYLWTMSFLFLRPNWKLHFLFLASPIKYPISISRQSLKAPTSIFERSLKVFIFYFLKRPFESSMPVLWPPVLLPSLACLYVRYLGMVGQYLFNSRVDFNY